MISLSPPSLKVVGNGRLDFCYNFWARAFTRKGGNGMNREQILLRAVLLSSPVELGSEELNDSSGAPDGPLIEFTITGPCMTIVTQLLLKNKILS